MAEKIQLSQADRKKVWWRSQFLQGSWNYERMQNLGWAYSLIPAIKKLYTNKDRSDSRWPKRSPRQTALISHHRSPTESRGITGRLLPVSYISEIVLKSFGLVNHAPTLGDGSPFLHSFSYYPLHVFNDAKVWLLKTRKITL